MIKIVGFSCYSYNDNDVNNQITSDNDDGIEISDSNN